MGLGINDVSIGASNQGVLDLLDDIKLEMVTNAKKELSDYKEVENALKKGWSGDDCDKFLKNFEKMEKEIENKLDEYYQLINKQLLDMYDQWREFQAKNVQ